MAISKILHMKDTGEAYHGKHLNVAINYVLNPEKTQDGRLVGAVNCQPEFAFEQMRKTKQQFGKTDKRQGYHLILSFTENEVTPDIAFEIVERFVKEFLGKSFEAVYVVHDNTEHVHGHIIFNSVSFLDGKKFRYEKGDWQRKIQPITNRLCREYGLSEIELEEETGNRKKSTEHYKEWNEIRDGRFVWSEMIKRDLDACILQSSDMEEFLNRLKEKGYEIKIGKHLAVKPQGMRRFRRLDTLGPEYEMDRLIQRIASENLQTYRQQRGKDAKIVRCYIKRYRRAKLSGIQKKYYARLYRLGQLKKKPYSQAWKYKDDVKKMQKLQQEYLFLVNHDIHNVEELVATVSSLAEKKKEAMKERSHIYREKSRNNELFSVANKMLELKPAEDSFISGDDFFEEEHRQWDELEMQLKSEGYTYDEVCALQNHYKELTLLTAQKAKMVSKELRLGEGILGELNNGEFVYEFERDDYAKNNDKQRNQGSRQHKEQLPG